MRLIEGIIVDGKIYDVVVSNDDDTCTKCAFGPCYSDCPIKDYPCEINEHFERRETK